MSKITLLFFICFTSAYSRADKTPQLDCLPNNCHGVTTECLAVESKNCDLAFSIGDNACKKLITCEWVGKTCTLKKTAKADDCSKCHADCLKARWDHSAEGQASSEQGWQDCFKSCAKRKGFDPSPY